MTDLIKSLTEGWNSKNDLPLSVKRVQKLERLVHDINRHLEPWHQLRVERPAQESSGNDIVIARVTYAGSGALLFTLLGITTPIAFSNGDRYITSYALVEEDKDDAQPLRYEGRKYEEAPNRFSESLALEDVAKSIAWEAGRRNWVKKEIRQQIKVSNQL